ncbi:MAG: MFS transporter, partial [Proteobacteria bacterium]|nr:MFS transporter [Pseudomonadota bacterium]
LTIEYVGLVFVFTAYAFVQNPYIGAGLYVIDHMFFALSIAMSTYFQKIARPEDIASSAGVSFTINHIAAVVVPAALGLVWMVSPAAVFLTGTGIAVCSLVLSRNIPAHPEQGNEVIWGRVGVATAG